jgi:hypothetical protein
MLAQEAKKSKGFDIKNAAPWFFHCAAFLMLSIFGLLVYVFAAAV